MYHFKELDNSFGAVVLDEYVELSGHTVRYLKEFQISAVRFLYNHFRKREFCILNDESGLGKTATAAVLLGTVAMKKNCLIVVANNDERVTDWRFHLNVLTDLNINVLDEEKDYDDNSAPSVFITKWNTLRAIDDISKMSFDIVILDNREQMMNNSFCVSTLLKCFEKKVQLVISSVDVTSDVKLMHNILRLGGRLEHQLESFKAFENKFYLPDIKAISNKKSDLEEYFIKREILNDYCRDFRLRRYRHQYEHMLPLVDLERYKAHLAQWSETAPVKKKAIITAIISESLPTEMGTEELLQQFVNQTNHNQQQLDEEVQKITNDMLTNGEVNSHNNHVEVTPNDANDDEMNMSPLVYISESSDSDEEVVMLSSNSIETVIPVIEVNDDDDDGESDSDIVQVCELKEQIQETVGIELNNQRKNHIVEENIEEKQNKIVSPNNEKKNYKKVKKAAEVKEAKGKEDIAEEEIAEPNKKRTRIKSSMQLQGSNDKRITTRLISQKDSKLSVETRKTTPRAVKDLKKLKASNQNTPTRKLHDSEIEISIKREKITPKKSTNEKKSSKKSDTTDTMLTPQTRVNAKKSCEKSDSKDIMSTPQRLSKQDIKISSSTVKSSSAFEREAGTEGSNIDKPNKRKRTVRKNVLGCMMGIPQRETRNMQRATRSTGSKRKRFALEFDDDKKQKMRVTPKKSPTSKVVSKKEESKQNINSKHKRESPDMSEQQTKMNTQETKTKSVDPEKSSLASTQGSSVMPTSSEYEEIQCGQKLVFDSSGDNSSHVMEKPNEFLMPSTPPSMRISQYSLLQQKPGTKSNVLFGSDSDLALLSSNKSPLETIILLSSSHDEESLSSQASNEQQAKRPLGGPKRKRYSKRKSIKEPSSFGIALTKERNAVKSKSPDLFSMGSDIASSTAIPFTQIHCNATTHVTNPAFGFKIFGSEVRRLSDISPSMETSQLKSRSGRSCLNLLEKMFEKRNTLPTAPAILIDKATESKRATKIPTRKRAKLDMDDTEEPVSTKALVTPRKPIHERNQQTIQRTDLTSDDIFEITNNTTFGSTMRINASGNISPVQQLSSSQHHNKITNYLIGSGNAKHISSTDDEHQFLATPNKQRLATQQQQSASGSTTVPYTRKSPKSTKPTQATKLTKWFRRSSIDDKIKDTRQILKDSKATKTTKRRRLDLSFKS